MDSENFSTGIGTETDLCTTRSANIAVAADLTGESLVRLVHTAVGLPAEALERLTEVADKLRAVEGLPLLDSTGE